MKRLISTLMEWVRPVGIGISYFLADYFATDPVTKFHLLGPPVVIIMSGSVAFESLVLREVASEKIGYTDIGPYQIQSGLNHLATAATALIVMLAGWGRFAEAAIVTCMLLTFTFSASNHLRVAITEKNLKPVNLMRPVMTLFLIVILVPAMWFAFK